MTHPTANHEGHVVVFDDDLNWSVEHPLECREHPTPMSQCPTSEFMRTFDMAPVNEAGRYTLDWNEPDGQFDFAWHPDAKPRALLDLLAEHLKRNGEVTLTVSKDEGVFVVVSEWGSEAKDSPMAGAAAYGMSDDLSRALRQMLDEAGVR